MKIKHIASIFLYFATFTLSVLIVGLPVNKSTFERKPCAEKQTVRTADAELRTRLLKFLQDDHKAGREYSEDWGRFRRLTNEVNAEGTATGILVKKMKAADCLNLPADFCLAWKEHLAAWDTKDKFFDQTRLADKPTINEDLRQEYLQINGEIGSTYFRLLEVARKYNVDFQY